MRAASAARFGAGRAADAHERGAGLLHDRAHVREVEVDEPGHRDQVADALDALAQHVVHHAEGVHDGRLLGDHVLEPVVGDGDERVDLVLELRAGLLGVQPAAGALEAEGLGHDADGQRAQVAGDLRDDRRRAGAGAAAHARGDEHHVRVLERLGDLLGVLLRGALADARVAARAQAAGDLVADADLVRRVGLEQRLRVRVHGDELDTHHLRPDHAVDGVAAAATDADDPDEREVLRVRSQRHVGFPPAPRLGSCEPNGLSSCMAWAGPVGARRPVRVMRVAASIARGWGRRT